MPDACRGLQKEKLGIRDGVWRNYIAVRYRTARKKAGDDPKVEFNSAWEKLPKERDPCFHVNKRPRCPPSWDQTDHFDAECKKVVKGFKMYYLARNMGSDPPIYYWSRILPGLLFFIHG